MSGGESRGAVLAAVITAVATVVAALIAVLIGHQAGVVNIGALPTITSTTTVTTSPGATDSITPSTSSSAGGDGVRHRTDPGRSIILSNGYSINFDSQEPGWGVGVGRPGEDMGYLVFADGDEDMSMKGGADAASMSTAPQSRADCDAATNWQQGNLNLAKMDLPISFCVRTTDRRYAALTVTSADSKQMIMTAVVWEQPFA